MNEIVTFNKYMQLHIKHVRKFQFHYKKYQKSHSNNLRYYTINYEPGKRLKYETHNNKNQRRKQIGLHC